MMQTIKIAQITDLHLVADKSDLIHNINTYNSARSIIQEVQKKHVDIDFIVFTGDLVEDESSEGYENLRNLIHNINCPVIMIPGNHDSPEKIGKICSQDKHNKKRFLINKNWILFMFNTKKDNSNSGIIHQDELNELNKLLIANPDKYFMIFMHHHVFNIGSSWMDKMIIENGNLLESILKINNNIKGIACGHVHQESFIEKYDVKFFSTPSTCYQFLPKTSTFKLDQASRPGYRIINLISDGNIETHVERYYD